MSKENSQDFKKEYIKPRLLINHSLIIGSFVLVIISSSKFSLANFDVYGIGGLAYSVFFYTSGNMLLKSKEQENTQREIFVQYIKYTLMGLVVMDLFLLVFSQGTQHLLALLLFNYWALLTIYSVVVFSFFITHKFGHYNLNSVKETMWLITDPEKTGFNLLFVILILLTLTTIIIGQLFLLNLFYFENLSTAQDFIIILVDTGLVTTGLYFTSQHLNTN